jgi:hypothetical protein
VGESPRTRTSEATETQRVNSAASIEAELFELRGRVRQKLEKRKMDKDAIELAVAEMNRPIKVSVPKEVQGEERTKRVRRENDRFKVERLKWLRDEKSRLETILKEKGVKRMRLMCERKKVV